MSLRPPAWKDNTLPGSPGNVTNSATSGRQDGQAHACLAAEGAFLEALRLECRRAERSRRSLLLALIHEKDSGGRRNTDQFTRDMLRAEPSLSASIRETDLRGWYRDRSIYGIVFTELREAPDDSVRSAISDKIDAALRKSLKPDDLARFQVSFHLFPKSMPRDGATPTLDSGFYLDLTPRNKSAKFSLSVKRSIDIFGSLFALVLLSPALAIIAIAIKLDSRGPVLFKQTRVGEHGGRFSLLKFRSMSMLCDPCVHEDYVKRYISGREDTKQSTADGKEVYKLARDQRVTRIGRFLRRTSLDELPQLINVLRGEMSLVGPRPPIPYELEAYDIWHMRRLLEARPGITGLWQVNGRSRTTFDEMVRLDLRYAKTWSLWLDLKILFQTPRAVLSGDGAY
jgi:lipopolysaccharide/colanic/teichoic acid biosynthesis glycosyltransferase